jgi:phage repressor protein C with HTH and peptisase S24 domain
LYSNRFKRPITPPAIKFSYARFFENARLSAGGGAFELDESFQSVLLPPIFADRLHAQNSVIDIVKVEGNSMKPTLKNGDR